MNEKQEKLCAGMLALTDGYTLEEWLTSVSLAAAWVCVDSGVSKEEFSRVFSKCHDLAVAAQKEASKK